MTECPVLNCSRRPEGFHDLQDHLEEDHGQLLPTSAVMEWAEKEERELEEALE